MRDHGHPPARCVGQLALASTRVKSPNSPPGSEVARCSSQRCQRSAWRAMVGTSGPSSAEVLFHQAARATGIAQAAASGAAVSRAAQVAGEEDVVRVTGQALAEALRLGVTRCVERHVGLALEALLAIPVGFAMADEQQLGHGRVTWQRVGRCPGRP
jgi:hypothetical protein